MIVFVAPKTKAVVVKRIVRTLEQHNVSATVTEFATQPVIVVTEKGSGGNVKDTKLHTIAAALPGVVKVIAVTDPFPLVSKKTHPTGTVVTSGSLTVGGGHFGVIAGPCSVETESQTLRTAVAIKKVGANALRGGAFKPRTSPYAFQGLKETGLKILAKARKETGLAIVTEAMSPDEVPLVADYADVVQIGTRNAQNFRLLEAAGRIRKPILLKRGFMCSVEEFLMSAEYILAGGNDQVILCERGIRTFETYTRYTFPVSAITEVKSKTHLPIIADPSHAAGKVMYVSPLARAATAAGADGLLVEVHPDPQHALCDGRQSLVFDEFATLRAQCHQIAKIVTS